MFELFTEKALKVLLAAQDEAKRTGHNFVGTEQILIGIMEEKSGIGAKALINAGVDIMEVRKEIDDFIGRGSGFVTVEAPFTPRAKFILDQALEQAKSFNHSYISTEHILLALLDDEDGVANHILKTKLNVSLNKIRLCVLEELGQIIDAAGLEIALGQDEIDQRRQERYEQLAEKRRRTKQKKEEMERIRLLIKEYRSIMEKHNMKGVKMTTGDTVVSFPFDLEGYFDEKLNDSSTYALFSPSEEKELEQLEKEKFEKEDIERRKALGEVILRDTQFEKQLEAIFRKKFLEEQMMLIRTPAIEEFCTNLSREVAEGNIDPVIGRENEVDRVVQILTRRRKNNPILIGEPGVGKTAVAEALALKIYNEQVAASLVSKEVVVLDLGSLVAGTKYRGEFEDRIKRIMLEVKTKKNIILVIDEVHTLIGAGSAEGSLDAANILKPALARGELQCIGATTLEEYKKIEKDTALERRFQAVNVPEPSKEDCLKILKGLRITYESFHGVRLPDSTLQKTIELSSLYIKDRFLPDKAIDVIDEACSKVKIESLLSHFGLVSDLEVKLQKVLDDKDTAVRANEFEIAAIFRDSEMSLRTQIKSFLKSVDAPTSLIKAQDSLPVVDTEHVSSILSSWTGIPLNKVGKDESKKLLNLDKEMHTRIIGQYRAVEAICDSIKRTRVNLRNKKQPIASFLFCGPTGVGKTEVTKTLSEVFFGSEKAMVRFDMSEFMERHSIARLIGAPPGYIGYSEGGQLTEAVRRKPFSLVLFDEVEKAHPDVFNLLLQVLDDGRLTDAKGKTIDFTNTIIIMTSNLGSHNIQQSINRNREEEQEKLEKPSQGIIGDVLERNKFYKIFAKRFPEKAIKYKTVKDKNKLPKPIPDISDNIMEMQFTDKTGTEINLVDSTKIQIPKFEEEKTKNKKYKEEYERIKDLVMNEIKSFFRPEFINRIDEIIIFDKLRKPEVKEICNLLLKNFITEQRHLNNVIVIEDNVKEYVVDNGYDPLYGARPLRRSIDVNIKNIISNKILETPILTERKIIVLSCVDKKKVVAKMYPLPGFLLSPFNKDIVNSPENDKAIDAILKAYLDDSLSFFSRTINKHYMREENDTNKPENLESEEILIKESKEKFVKKLEDIRLAEKKNHKENNLDSKDNKVDSELLK